jgi:predicted Zn-dependent peptidase
VNRTLALAALLLTILPASAGAQQVDVEEFVLDNGMKFLLCPRSGQPNSVSAGWVAQVGSVNERPGITGLSHFFEHMMFKGSPNVGTTDPEADAALNAEQHAVRARLRHLVLEQQYARWRQGEIDDPWDPAADTTEMKTLRGELKALMDKQREVTVANEFDAIYTKLGGSRMNAFTNHDETFYFIQVPSNKLELWCWMESNRLHDPVFREFYAERDVVHEERRMRTESTPTGKFQEQFEALFWQSSPYSWPVIGWPSDLNNYTIEQARAYFETYYRPNNLVGVLVGDFDPVEAKRQIIRYFSRLEAGDPPPPVVTIEIQQLAEKRMYAEADAAPRIEVRYHTVPHGHPDEFALEVLSEVLNGRTGRLQRSLVEDQQLATSAGVRQDTRKYAGAFSFLAECKAEASPEQVEEAWYQELERLQEEPVGETELQKVMNRSQADAFRRLEGNFFLMLQLGVYEALGEWSYINVAPRKILAVTAEDIQRVAKAYFARENRSVAIYKRKPGAQAKPEDPRLAGLDPQLKAMAEQALGQVEAVSDPAELRQHLAAMEAQLEQVPPPVKPVVEIVIEAAQDRLAELEADQEESE